MDPAHCGWALSPRAALPVSFRRPGAARRPVGIHRPVYPDRQPGAADPRCHAGRALFDNLHHRYTDRTSHPVRYRSAVVSHGRGSADRRATQPDLLDGRAGLVSGCALPAILDALRLAILQRTAGLRAALWRGWNALGHPEGSGQLLRQPFSWARRTSPSMPWDGSTCPC